MQNVNLIERSIVHFHSSESIIIQNQNKQVIEMKMKFER